MHYRRYLDEMDIFNILNKGVIQHAWTNKELSFAQPFVLMCSSVRFDGRLHKKFHNFSIFKYKFYPNWFFWPFSISQSFTVWLRGKFKNVVIILKIE